MRLDYALPYYSQRPVVMARNVVATSQALAAQAGLAMLQKGGNAVDAAVATAITMTILEPTGNGIGSDAFCILWDGRELHGLNASGRSPAAFEAKHLEAAGGAPGSGGAVPRGWNSVTVPGAVSAWVELSGRFGRLPFETLFEPAIRYASDGFPVQPITARAWGYAEKAFGAPEFAEFRRVFLPGGRAPRAGERFSMPDHARTLELIAKTRGEAFYRGELAEAMVEDARRHGATLALSDLADHRPDWVGTVSQPYRELELHEIPPNGQGLAALLVLGILKHTNVAELPVDCAASLHLQIEAMKLAFADVYAYVADAAHMSTTAEQLLDPGYLAGRARLIDASRAQVPEYGVPSKGGTIYLTAADAGGMMVSYIQSNYYGFGSGVVVPGTGISLQNRGAGFVTTPGHPNFAEGGKRPFHTIIPTFLTRGGAPLMSYGVMGGPMQPQGHAQVALRLADHGQNPQAIADAPRWRVMGGLEVALESGYSAETVAELERLGHVIHQSKLGEDFGFGGAQLILRQEDGGYVAGSDPRKDGMAVGY
ncbi:MAG: gamma-glutamyltransferase family protein [Trueperaceae bacterium]|nr:gamma-glutamyltransferase family protein [Trueperaceae bacterium]MCO5175316.1 gamma-glutamyltransferase family protein [Trueperaceae bacterium]